MVYNAGKVDVPRQLVIERDASSIPDVVLKAGLTLPLGMYLYAWSRLCINLVAKIKFRHLAVMFANFKIT